ncbi:MAG TPA: endonuclease/exonuclease/phosphatase family protein, partial [Candidatus Hydrogenedentes bacterium]|nr:endonuclease/exonuclease/phosphatase family protein [Candidatus Hydrogenedentota bacterium]
MILMSWNVNGLRAALKNGFMEWFNVTRPDVLCLQET